MLARRMADLVQDAPGRGMHREDLARQMGTTSGVLWKQGLGLAYARGWVDFVRNYVVAPAGR